MGASSGLLTPINKVAIYNGSAPGPNTNIQVGGSDIDLEGDDGDILRITVALTNASVFNIHATDGSTPHVWGLNESVQLNAGDIYTFVVGIISGITYNFQVETDGVIETLVVDLLNAEVV